MGVGLLGMFGAVVFTCSSVQVMTFKDLQVQRTARFAMHNVLGQKPMPEYIGPDATTVTFNIQLRNQYNSPPNVYLPILQTILETGKAQTLILGSDYFGDYILEGFTENRLYHTGLGVCIGADVTLNLKEASGFNLVKKLVKTVAEVTGVI